MLKRRIFLVDDHLVLREVLALLINRQPDMEVVGEASDGRDVVQQVLTCEPNLVIMDISLPGQSGIEITRQLRQCCPDVQVVTLTRHSEPGYVQQLLQAGAHGYVLKRTSSEALLSAIRAVAAGGTYLDSELSQQSISAHLGQNEGVRGELSEREIDVVRLTAHGYTNKEIAAQLGISVKTVDTYKSRAMDKLGLYSRADLVRYALKLGWLDPS
jgi:two-component system, NarL family, response regulator NreC